MLSFVDVTDRQGLIDTQTSVAHGDKSEAANRIDFILLPCSMCIRSRVRVLHMCECVCECECVSVSVSVSLRVVWTLCECVCASVCV